MTMGLLVSIGFKILIRVEAILLNDKPMDVQHLPVAGPVSLDWTLLFYVEQLHCGN